MFILLKTEEHNVVNGKKYEIELGTNCSLKHMFIGMCKTTVISAAKLHVSASHKVDLSWNKM